MEQDEIIFELNIPENNQGSELKSVKSDGKKKGTQRIPFN
jgi:hypothetical protein